MKSLKARVAAWKKSGHPAAGNPSALTAAQALAPSRDRIWVALLLGFPLVALAWAAWAPVDRIVRAEGRIITAGRAQVVQHLEGGIVSAISVREGQAVQVGEVVMRLSDVPANTSLQQGKTQVLVLKAKQARLNAEAEGRTTVDFESSIPDDVQSLERMALRERSSRIGSELSVLRQQISQRQAELVEAQGRGRNLGAELEVARKQALLMDGLLKKGAGSQLEWLEAQGRVDRLVTAHNDVVNSVPRLQSAIGETASRLSESATRFRAEARSELNQVSAEISRIQFAVGGDSDRLARTEVRAPMAGFVNRLYFNTIGGVVKPGEPVLEITPTEGPLAVEGRVRPDDRASLRAGLPARVMLGAYDYSVYGALDARLVEVSADTVPDEHGLRYYRVVLQTSQAKGRLAGEVILPGMTAHADVVVGQRGVLTYLLSPLLRFTTQALREPT